MQQKFEKSRYVTIMILLVSSLAGLRIYATHSQRAPVEFSYCGRQIFAAEKSIVPIFLARKRLPQTNKLPELGGYLGKMSNL